MTDISAAALFRLSVLGPLASRERLERGEIKRLIEELASRTYSIPGAKRTRRSRENHRVLVLRLAPRRHRGASAPSRGATRGAPSSRRSFKRSAYRRPRRSLNRLLRLLEMAGRAAQGELSRSSLHRLLQRHGLSRVTGCPSAPVERRSLVAAQAGDIWYGVPRWRSRGECRRSISPRSWMTPRG